MAQLQFRRALASDLPEIVALLADDMLGGQREDPSIPLARAYVEAFEAIAANPDQYLMVASEEGRTVGTLQLIVMAGLSRKGGWRGQIEGVRIVADRRGRGLGEQLVHWAIAECRARHSGRPQGRAARLRRADPEIQRGALGLPAARPRRFRP